MKLYTVVRYAVDPAQERRPLPLVTDTLPLAEAVRFALMGLYQRRLHLQKFGHADKPYQERFFSRTLSGKDAAGTPLQGHAHAFFLPADEDGDGRIDHVTVVADHGFNDGELQALDRLRQVRFGDGEPLRLLLVGLGSDNDFRVPLLDTATSWLSATPFVATRYPKLRGRKKDRPQDYATPLAFAAHVLRQELERWRQRRGADVAAALSIEPLAGLGEQQLRPLEFRRGRQKRGDDGSRRPSGAFRLVFAGPVRGPVCLGHSCHFGLGLFLPQRSAANCPF